MGETNIPDDEKAALRRIDVSELVTLVDRCVEEERIDALQTLPLSRCGPYVSREFDAFERALSDHRESNGMQKRLGTWMTADRRVRNLVAAVRDMHDRVRRDEADAELFRIEDRIPEPLTVGRNLSVRVVYRWRRTIDDAWNEGGIVFRHTAVEVPEQPVPVWRRKPGPAERKRALQDELRITWRILKSGALHSVRGFFREGHDGGEIPDMYEVRLDPRTRVLTNHSTDFWRVRPGSD